VAWPKGKSKVGLGPRPVGSAKVPGSGRKPGTPNKATAKREAVIAATGMTPLEYMIEVMRTSTDAGMKLRAAEGAAPYVHPKLAQMALTHDVTDSLAEVLSRIGSKRRDGS